MRSLWNKIKSIIKRIQDLICRYRNKKLLEKNRALENAFKDLMNKYRKGAI
jgi:flagellar biosynthesis/type III secretory pathway chaperone